MKNYTRQYLRGLLREYPLLESKIQRRIESLRNPDQRELDENIGGSQGNLTGDPVAAVAVRVSDDDLLKLYEVHKKAVDVTLGQFDKPIQNIIKLRYFEQLKQDDVSKELGMTIAAIRVGENAFLKKLANRLNLMR